MHPQALPFGALTPLRAIRRLSPRAAATGLGALAIPLWATWPTLAMWSASLPAFEILTIAFLVGWLVLGRLEPAPTERTGSARTGAARSWRQEALPVLACALGLTFTHAFFILATSFIPAAQANLLVYLWPTLLVCLGAASGLFRLRARHGLGLLLGFGGAAIVIGAGTLASSASGIGLALLSGVCWASYCLFRLRQGAGATNVLAPACLVSALLCAGLHLALEPTVVPGPGALVAAIAIGVAPVALANFAWDQGLRRGNSRLLAVMAYGTPVVSALILIAAGIATATPTLLIGALMIVGAGLVSRGEAR